MIKSLIPANIFRLFILFCSVFCLPQGSSAQSQFHVKHYTIDDGLPHNVGFEILQDSKGYMWIGTDDGLARFDGKNFKVYRSNDGLLSNFIVGLTESQDGALWIGAWKGGLNVLKNDTIYTPNIDYPLFNVSYIGVNNDQLLLSDSKNQVFSYIRKNNGWQFTHHRGKHRLYVKNKASIIYSENTFLKDKTHPQLKPLSYINAYLTHNQSILFFGNQPGVWKHHNDSTFTPFYPEVIQQNMIYCLSQDAHQKYWLGAKGKIITIDPKGKVSIINKGLPAEFIYKIKVNTRGHIYFITKSKAKGLNQGFYRYNPHSQELIDMKEKLGLKSLPSYIEIDKEDNVWLTTSGEGVYCISTFLAKNYDDKSGLSNLFVRAIKEDSTGNIYVKTLGGLYTYQNGRFVTPQLFSDGTQYKVTNLFTDKEKRLLTSIIAYNGIPHLLETKGNNYKVSPRVNTRYTQYIDSKGDLWFIAGTHLVRQSNPSTSPIKQWFALPKAKLSINQIFEHNHQHWIATNVGLLGFDTTHFAGKQQQTLRFADTLGTAQGLATNNTKMVAKDANGALWVATSNGICKLENDQFICFDKSNGLVDNNCTSLLFDHLGRLWVGTSKGLSCFDGERFTNYTHKTGLISSDIQSIFLDSKQQLWVGTSKGISVMNLSILPQEVSPPPLYIDAIEINEVPHPLNKYLLNIDYDASLRVYFNSLTYTYPEGVRFRYRLNAGKWRTTSLNFADFNALRSGTYTFEVQTKRVNGSWSLTKKLKFRVFPPFWWTWWAITSYGLLCILFIYLIVKQRFRRLEKEKLKLEVLVVKRTYELEQQKEEIAAQSNQLKEMDQMKSRFFSNISHEFRTPLTLIIEPARKLLEPLSEKYTQIYSQTILTNAQRLLRLINQVLDLTKLENSKVTLQLSEQEFVGYLKNIIDSFGVLAKQKNIDLTFKAPQQAITCVFDDDKLEKVFFNLLSNAFKFTPQNETISIEVFKHTNALEVQVSDTGIGIPEESLPFIFNRFYQLDTSQTRAYEGSGIGLTLTKEFVELHEGSIEVNSVLDKGTSFLVKLPILTQSAALPLIASANAQNSANVESQLVSVDYPKEFTTVNNTSKDKVLVVEDNHELRKFICIELAPFYEVLEATNGAEGITMALDVVPDLIVSDIMMPKVDGFELLHTLRNNPLTSHISIIMLSAKASEESKIKGLKTGGDDYITKPFNAQELLLRIKNTLDRREKLRALFQQNAAKPHVAIEPSQVTLASMDETFLKQAIKIVEEHIGNPEFGAAFFYKAMGMSQSSLYRKLKALTGLSVTEFIRTIKLKRAASLIKQKVGTIEEVAFQAGFNDMSYFYKSFKRQFGVTPTEYQK